MKKVKTLEYKDDEWDVRLPTVDAYSFTSENISQFRKGTTPLPGVFDINLLNACNTNCRYCSTEGGKADIRFGKGKDFQPVSDSQMKEMIAQFGELGVKTFFLCSNGEPLLNVDRFVSIINGARDRGVKIITYTNGTTLTPSTLETLHEEKVNLIMKLESLRPKVNDNIILNTRGKRKKSFSGYRYRKLGDVSVPSHILDAHEIYGENSDMLGIETMITNDNLLEILDIRSWAYDELGIAQFLKHLYPLGYATLRGAELLPSKEDEKDIKKSIYELDSKRGIKYPSFPTPDYYSYDARRLINNLTNQKGFPFRTFAHEKGGVYHNSSVVPVKFGFDTQNIVSLLNEEGNVDVENYFNNISKILESQKVKS